MIDLASPTPDDLRNFVVAVTGKAVTDHFANNKRRPTGEQLVYEFCSAWRGFHKNMATTIYNKTRQSLECSGRP